MSVPVFFKSSAAAGMMVVSISVTVALLFATMVDMPLSAELQVQVNGCNDTRTSNLNADNAHNMLLQNMHLTTRSEVVVRTQDAGMACKKSKESDCTGYTKYSYDVDNIDDWFKNQFFDAIYPQYLAGNEWHVISGNSTRNITLTDAKQKAYQAMLMCFHKSEEAHRLHGLAVSYAKEVTYYEKENGVSTQKNFTNLAIQRAGAARNDSNYFYQPQDFGGGCFVSCDYMRSAVIRGMKTQLPGGDDGHFLRRMVYVYPMLGAVLLFGAALSIVNKPSLRMPLKMLLLFTILVVFILAVVHQSLLHKFIKEMHETDKREGLIITIILCITAGTAFVLVALTDSTAVTELKNDMMANFL